MSFAHNYEKSTTYHRLLTERASYKSYWKIANKR